MASIFYARVSTLEQTLDHQLTQAKAAGFVIDDVVADQGVSGVQYRLADRPEGRRLFDKLRHGDELIVRWVDRLGRDYNDVCDTIRHFIRQGVAVRTVINNMVFDGSTKDPVQMAVRDAMIAFLAATAQAQAEATKIAQRAGIEAARGQHGKYRGRKPSFDRADLMRVQALLDQDLSVSAISKDCGLSRQSVMRIRDTPDNAEAILARWGL